MYMGNERFAGPELLFNPSDIGGLTPPADFHAAIASGQIHSS